MTSSLPPHDDDPPDSGAALSGDAVTPRGGFMARPGFKSPPRHAVVVRGGDAPGSEHIPRFRSSIPPPPPAAEPAAPSNDEMATLRAIPTPLSRKVAPAPEAAPVVESLPPPSAPLSAAPLSDAPFVANAFASGAPESQRRGRSRWAIFAAAAAGLMLGLGSVAARVYAPGLAAQPSPAATLIQSAATPLVATAPSAPPALASSAAPLRGLPPATPASEPSSAAEGVPSDSKPGRQAAPSVKRSIF